MRTASLMILLALNGCGPSASCTVAENGDGTSTITCGEDSVTLTNGADGAAGVDGASCAVADNGDGTSTVTCGDVSVVISDGADGAEGTDGTSCTGTDNGDGSFTIDCDGTTMVLTDPGWVPPAYSAADGIEGGSAYSMWWVTQAGGPGNLSAAGVSSGAEWSRCKTCHGWDGLGNAASYADRTGKSTGTASRPDVSSVDLRAAVDALTPQELFDSVRGEGGRPIDEQGNGHPDYSDAMTDEQVWALVKFMREEWVHPEALYLLAVDGPPVYTAGDGTVVKPTLTYYGVGADGDATAGATIFSGKCAGCHGADGKKLALEGFSAGQFVRRKPHEAWLKIKFGRIDADSTEHMKPGLLLETDELVDLYKALSDKTKYPDLP